MTDTPEITALKKRRSAIKTIGAGFSFPETAHEGDTFFNKSNSLPYIYVGGKWELYLNAQEAFSPTREKEK